MSKIVNITELKEAVDRFIADMERVGVTPGVEVISTDNGKYLVVAFTVEELIEAIKSKKLSQYIDRIEASVIPFNGEHWIRIAIRI